jgi:hypothetical protein
MDDAYQVELKAGRGGWTRFAAAGQAPAYVRWRLGDGGRLEVAELYLTGAPITATALRDLPLTDLQAWANSPKMRDTIVRQLDDPGPDLAGAAADFATYRYDHPELRRLRRAGLPVPTGASGKHPDSFYRRVAKVYAGLAEQTSRPAVEIAEANNLPVSTVHRWIKEARRRGFLAPGQRGVRG